MLWALDCSKLTRHIGRNLTNGLDPLANVNKRCIASMINLGLVINVPQGNRLTLKGVSVINGFEDAIELSQNLKTLTITSERRQPRKGKKVCGGLDPDGYPWNHEETQ